MRKIVIFLAFVALAIKAQAQRNYAHSSVLATGRWVKIAVDSPGIHIVRGDFLQKAGFPPGISSRSIRLFGNGAAVLPESNQIAPPDDLEENAIEVFDGGDGIFDAGDYFLFFAKGPHQWKFDSLSGQFRYLKNPYTSNAFYFITISGAGLRITDAPILTGPAPVVDSFDECYHHELDSINFLKSGKEWYGEDFSASPGRSSLREFSLSVNDAVNGSRFSMVSEVVGKSYAKPNAIDVHLNGQLLFQHTTPTSTGTLLEPYANPNRQSGLGIMNSNTLKVSYRFVAGSVNAEAWLNWFDIFFKRSLTWQGSSQLHFRDLSSIGKGSKSAFTIRSAGSQVMIWDVTEPLRPLRVRATSTGSDLQFIADCSILREYIAFGNNFRIPRLVGDVVNQDLHGTPAHDMVVVTTRSLFAQADRLASFHRQQGLKVIVVDVDQIYNEFAYGTNDPTAIRNFMKMLYDRALKTQISPPRYLLLFGGASYVFKEKENKRNNLVPSYQSSSSLDPLTSYVSDDYFGYLDDHEDINASLPAPLLDLAIGRIPARTAEQAKVAVDKVINYRHPSSLGAWRNGITLIADDEDYNIHMQDAELHARVIEDLAPAWDIQKIYLDAFEQVSGSGGATYPAVNEKIKKGIDDGTLIWNYSGHGSSTRLAQESILEKASLPNFRNQEKLPLFITATCDFAPFDDPSLFSIGEELLVGRTSGAVGLLTTTRLVFAASNKVMNNNYFRSLFQKNAAGVYPTLGESLTNAKNFTVVNSGDYINARKFTLLGDPALKLAMPEFVVQTLTINGKPLGSDTLKALNSYTIEGEIRKPGGVLATDFNGFVYPRLYDKPVIEKTKANDPQSTAFTFGSWGNPIYNGKIKVDKGRFSFNVIVPKDIDLRYGKGRLGYYAENGIIDANGTEGNFLIGGFGNEAKNDGQGPVIKAFLDDENFINGGTVGEAPILLVNLYDASGINISGIGIGHDITAVLDGNVREIIVLNEYFEAQSGANDLRGKVRFPLPALEEGKHRLLIKAWDVFNNSSTYEIEFMVVKQKQIFIDKFINYPNPFFGLTQFMIQLDGPLNGATIHIDILDLNGRLVQSLSRTINDASQRSYSLDWDGKSVNGTLVGRGTYLARLVARTKEGKVSRKVRNLIIH